MVGFCGINCSECAAYKATLSGDEQGLAQVAAKFGKGVLKPLDWVCLGCSPQNRHLLATYCHSCGIRRCAMAMAVELSSAPTVASLLMPAIIRRGKRPGRRA